VDVLRSRVTVCETAIDVGGKITFGEPKTPKSKRIIPLARSIMREVEQHLGEYVAPGPEALIFTSAAGTPLYRGTFWPSVWKPAVRAAGLDGLRVHDLRHTYVSLMVAAGANPKEVSTWAGHSSVSFTLDRYGHLYDEHGDDVADRLDQLLSQGRARISEATDLVSSRPPAPHEQSDVGVSDAMRLRMRIRMPPMSGLGADEQDGTASESSRV
jgi:hypothetical protein